MPMSEDDAREGSSKQINGDAKQRNRRMLANIQSALGTSGAALKTQRRRPSPMDNACAFSDIFDMLNRLQLADTDASVSLSDIRPYVLENQKLFGKEELHELSKKFCESALMQTNAHYIVGLCVDLCYNRAFMDEMAQRLKIIIESFINAGDNDIKELNTFPEFLAQLAMAKWPRGKDKAFDVSNPVLFTIVNAVFGWINLVVDSSNNNSEIEASDLPILTKCCEAIYTFCMIGQRSIWLNFPEIFDRVYEATSSLLTSNIYLSRSLKSSFLQLYTLLNKWSISNTKKFTSSGTQTIYRP